MTPLLFASSLFRALFLPPACFFLMLACAWAVSKRWPRHGKFMTITTLALFLIFCTPVGADLLVSPLEAMTKPLTPGDAVGSNGQAIVVLAAGLLRNAPEYGDLNIPDYVALARLRYAARLQHETGLPLLVTGGDRFADGVQQTLAAGMARAMREDFRTPVEWVEDASRTTQENATFSARILRANRIDHILLITDAMHMARARQVFLASGIRVTDAPTMFFRNQKLQYLSFFPSAEGLRRSYYAAYEWIGLLLYRLRSQGSS